MEILVGNVTKCNNCDCVMKYGINDAIPAVECPKCGKLVRASGVSVVSIFDALS